ncbi:hypothetical protein V6R21_10405 [Limibacter armeniacum]|uniref:hypothetical protein n=1 Tax=Limibacter armeniacum TaxID=466084 RepID=UPI002FE6A56B
MEIAVSPLGTPFQPFIATSRQLSQSYAAYYNLSRKFSIGFRFQNNSFNDQYTIKEFSDLHYTDGTLDLAKTLVFFSIEDNVDYHVDSYSFLLKYHFSRLKNFNPFVGLAVSLNHRYTEIKQFEEDTSTGVDQRAKSLSEATRGYNTGVFSPEEILTVDPFVTNEFLVSRHNVSGSLVAGIDWNFSRSFALQFQVIAIDLINRVTIPNIYETVFVFKNGPDAQQFAENVLFPNPRENRQFKDPNSKNVIAFLGSSSGTPVRSPIVYIELSFIMKLFYKK